MPAFPVVINAAIAAALSRIIPVVPMVIRATVESGVMLTDVPSESSDPIVPTTVVTQRI